MTDGLEDLNFTCRYDVTGIRSPDCKRCSMTSLLPVKSDDGDQLLATLWTLAEARSTQFDDDWHFVPCPDCNGEDRDIFLAKRLLSKLGEKRDD